VIGGLLGENVRIAHHLPAILGHAPVAALGPDFRVATIRTPAIAAISSRSRGWWSVSDRDDEHVNTMLTRGISGTAGKDFEGRNTMNFQEVRTAIHGIE